MNDNEKNERIFKWLHPDKCWHEYKSKIFTSVETRHLCRHCTAHDDVYELPDGCEYHTGPQNPQYHASLDAWGEVWRKLFNSDGMETSSALTDFEELLEIRPLLATTQQHLDAMILLLDKLEKR